MKMHRNYRYVGASDLLELINRESARAHITSAADVQQWIAQNNPSREYDDTVVVTFIIAVDGTLWINDRRSEHVLCAAGHDVLSSGEMTFALVDGVEVVAITNQSTGYCPEPESWWAVERALDNATIPHPDTFTTPFIFRKCESCGTKNIVKDDWFVCAVCDTDLPAAWNF